MIVGVPITARLDRKPRIGKPTEACQTAAPGGYAYAIAHKSAIRVLPPADGQCHGNARMLRTLLLVRNALAPESKSLWVGGWVRGNITSPR